MINTKFTKMNKYLLITVTIIVIAVATSCTNMEAITDLLNKPKADIWNGYDHFKSNNMTAILYADNAIEVGTVTFGLEKVGAFGCLTASYELKGGWEMAESQLYVGRPEDLKTKQFPYVVEHMSRVSSYTQYVFCNELPPLNQGISIAAQALVRSLDGQEETAFADGHNDLLTAL